MIVYLVYCRVPESKHRTFDAQTSCIRFGEATEATQLSRRISATWEVKRDGKSYPVGFLRDNDLNDFWEMAPHVRSFVDGITIIQPVILYEFWHNEKGRGITDGYVITSENGRLLQYFVTGPTFKSRSVIDSVLPIVTRQDIDFSL